MAKITKMVDRQPHRGVAGDPPSFGAIAGGVLAGGVLAGGVLAGGVLAGGG